MCFCICSCCCCCRCCCYCSNHTNSRVPLAIWYVTTYATIDDAVVVYTTASATEVLSATLSVRRAGNIKKLPAKDTTVAATSKYRRKIVTTVVGTASTMEILSRRNSSTYGRGKGNLVNGSAI